MSDILSKYNKSVDLFVAEQDSYMRKIGALENELEELKEQHRCKRPPHFKDDIIAPIASAIQQKHFPKGKWASKEMGYNVVRVLFVPCKARASFTRLVSLASIDVTFVDLWKFDDIQNGQLAVLDPKVDAHE